MLAVFGLAGIATFADHGEDDSVEELMENIHEGKRSPYRQVKRQVEAQAPAWPIVDAAIPRFAAMRRALLESRNAGIKESADGYADAVQGLADAARKRDAPALRKAVDSLSQSCGDCHFEGGAGGEIDD
jgi:hypothetical protein